MSEMRWHIGKETAPHDQPPYRAYFFWVKDNFLVDAKDYDANELAAELQRRREAGESLEPFEDILQNLLRANG